MMHQNIMLAKSKSSSYDIWRKAAKNEHM